jgi:hypothetical protein
MKVKDHTTCNQLDYGNISVLTNYTQKSPWTLPPISLSWAFINITQGESTNVYVMVCTWCFVYFFNIYVIGICIRSHELMLRGPLDTSTHIPIWLIF